MDNQHKRISGGFVGAAGGAAMTVIQSVHPEWFGNHAWLLPVSLVVLLCSLLYWLTQYRWFQFILGISHKDSVGLSTEALEKSIEEILVRKGVAKEELKESPVEMLKPDSVGTPAKLDGEIYRIVRSEKNPYSEITRQLWEQANRGKEFAIDIDILVEMYVVNTSSETQYIRDLCGSVEIDGVRIPLVREKDFSAFDLLDEHWEYCLDPTPNESPIIMAGRSESLTPLFPSLPTPLEPSQPVEGWVRFLLKERDPRKLEENRTYNFVLKDSLGVEYQIGRAANPQRTTPPVKSRKKRA